MIDTIGPLLSYLGVKLAAYSLWSAVGLRWLAPTRPRTAAASLGLGALRLSLGLLFGLSLSSALAAASPVPSRIGFQPGLFYALLVPLRWVEWGVVSATIRRSAAGAVLGAGLRDGVWRALGVVVACATDAAVLFTVGVMGWMPC